MSKDKGNSIKICISVISLACFAFIAYCVTRADFLPFDTIIREWVYGLRGPVQNTVFIIITYMGNWQFVGALAIIFLLAKGTRKPIGIPLATSTVVSIAVYKIVKSIFQRPRPDVALHIIDQGGYSFPSGHSMNCILFYGMLIYLLRKNMKNKRAANWLTVLLTVLIFLIGFSRVYVGVHFPTDVLGGWSLGIALMMIAIIAIERIEAKCQ